MTQPVGHITSANRNPGIVPPWLTTPVSPDNGNGNPGIVPPWLQDDVVRILPIDEDIVTILPIDEEIVNILPVTSPNGAVQTTFDKKSTSHNSPQPVRLIDAIRSR